jgi:DNA primase
VARIKDASVDAVKAAADIVEVVSLRTSLRRVSGARFTGRCPFHEERTPSFSVDPVAKLYHCFGCGVGGDVIKFVRESENLDFVGAIEWLADRFRITLEYEESTPREDAERRRRDRMTKLLEQAAAYFERVLWETDAGEPVRAYLAERRLGEEVSREFRLGLSRGVGLVAKAKESGFSLEEIRAAGLANQRGNDYFPFRLMFPLSDARGRIVGFQARKLRDDDPLRGKYVNTPESDLFKKGNVLYGLHLARPAIAKQDRAIVVEGNTDVIALRQAGVEAVVASMGTALTEHQLRELGRLTRRLFLCFDADAAGQEATLRGMQLAVTQGFDVRVVALPRGEDPADAPDAFAARLGTAESYLPYRVRVVLERTEDRQEAFVRTREILAAADDSPERQEALRLVADRLDLPRETLPGLAPSRAAVGTPRTVPEAAAPRLLEAGLQRERDLLAAVVRSPSLLDELAALTPDHFDDPLHRRFRAVLVDGAAEDDELVALRAELGARAERDALDERTGRELALRLHERKLRRDLQGADLARATELQARLAKIRAALHELA